LIENKVAKREIEVYIFSYARERKAKSGDSGNNEAAPER